MTRLYIFKLTGYQEEDPTGKIFDAGYVEVFAKNEKDALEKAAKLMQKKYWKLTEIIEDYPPAEGRPQYSVKLQRFDFWEKASGTLTNSVVLYLFENTVEEAIAVAKRLVERKDQRVATIVEKLPTRD